MDKTIPITPTEAMLIDWILTMHTYDISRLEQLETPLMIELRELIAPLIVQDKGMSITFTEKELKYLLITVPITFRFYKDDVGFSLKKKLLGTLVVPRIDWEMEVQNEDSNSSLSDKNDTQSQPEDSP